MSTSLKPPGSSDTQSRRRIPVLNILAVGRIALGIASLAAPRAFGKAVGVTATPESTYLGRVYGARACAMGTAFITSGQPERSRWARFSLAIDICDTASGAVHLLRRDAPWKAIVAMLTLTGSYALLGAFHLLRGNDDIR